MKHASSFTCLVLMLTAGAPRAAALQFTEVGLALGIDHVQAPPGFTAPGLGTEAPFMTGGACAGDYDGDGWVDLYFTRLDQADVLYRNLGEDLAGDHLGFEDVTLAAFGPSPAHAVPTNGCGFEDLDRDGDLDLYVTTLGYSPYLLFINAGDGTFTEQALARGVDMETGFPHGGFSPSFGDYDNDGWIDIYVAEWGNSNVDPIGLASHARLFRNRGASSPGSFQDTTLRAGVSIDDALPMTVDGLTFIGQYSFTPRFCDLDRDGFQDLHVACDFGVSRLFFNRGNGTFFETTMRSGVGTDENGMGCAIGDWDGDGWFDIFVTSIFDPNDTCAGVPCNWHDDGNRFYRNRGNRKFVDETDLYGLRDGGWGWGATFFDMDNDQDLDLAQTNGIVFSTTLTEDYFNDDPTRLWRNEGAGVPATDVAAALGVTDNGSGKGILTADWDRDGDRDLIVIDNQAAPHVYRNDLANGNGWLQIDLVGTSANARGIGALIKLRATAGSSTQYREVSASSNYLAQDEVTAHFGLGPGSAPVLAIQVFWPGGDVQTLTDVPRNQRITIVQP